METYDALINGDIVEDITGSVQTIELKDKNTGDVVYRCNGIVIRRSNHINGNAAIFLSRNGVGYGFGRKIISYTINERFKSWDYAKYDIEADFDNTVYFDQKHLRDLCVL